MFRALFRFYAADTAESLASPFTGRLDQGIIIAIILIALFIAFVTVKDMRRK